MEASSTSPPEPGKGPIDKDALWETIHLWRSDNQIQSLPCGKIIIENEDNVAYDLCETKILGSKNSKDPDSWGYVLYRLCQGPGMDQRFAAAIEKLERWIRYLTIQRRYSSLEPGSQDYLVVDQRCSDGRVWPSQDLAARFRFNIIENIPDEEGELETGLDVPDGDDYFMPVGAAFVNWVKENALCAPNHYDRYVGNDHCVIIDEKCLVTLEALPEETPTPGPTESVSEDSYFMDMEGPIRNAWVWLLDREYYLRFLEFSGDNPNEVRLPPFDAEDEDRFEPWARIHMDDLAHVWLDRSRGCSPYDWDSCIKRDEEVWEAISWWGGFTSSTENTIWRAARRK